MTAIWAIYLFSSPVYYCRISKCLFSTASHGQLTEVQDPLEWADWIPRKNGDVYIYIGDKCLNNTKLGDLTLLNTYLQFVNELLKSSNNLVDYSEANSYEAVNQ